VLKDVKPSGGWGAVAVYTALFLITSTWKILKLDWITPGIIFIQKSGNPVGIWHLLWNLEVHFAYLAVSP